jgi:multiple sugar transport system permease protein
MLTVSFGKNPDFLSYGGSFVFTLENFGEILTNESVRLLDYLRNSILISGLSALFATVFAGLSAYSITRFSFPGRILLPVLLLAVSMFPQISIAGYMFKFMSSLEWINTYNALVFPYTALGLPLALWIMLSYFSRISIELDKAALVDGAGRLMILRKIIFPIALPGVFSAFILVFIYSFNEFLFSLMLTIDYRARTVPVSIALFEGLHGQIPWGYIMASAVIATIPIIILVVAAQKYVIEGLSRGAVKG